MDDEDNSSTWDGGSSLSELEHSSMMALMEEQLQTRKKMTVNEDNSKPQNLERLLSNLDDLLTMGYLDIGSLESTDNIKDLQNLIVSKKKSSSWKWNRNKEASQLQARPRLVLKRK